MKLNDPTLFQSQAYLDGAWVDGDDNVTFAVTNPANGETLTQVAMLGVAETRRAIEAAEAALPAWRAQTAKARSAILRRWFDLIMQNQE
ncbi:MAG: aldehyde dehydrogenase family protein, partial [Pseudogulbenkiania sp.]|nr:aldehyde dehydrogenase family protein [Pseudogulbenkiania sp.]